MIGELSSTDLAITLVHGTFARDADWTKDGSPLRASLAFSLGDRATFHVFNWSGKNTTSARVRAGIGLARHLRRVRRSNLGAKQVVIAHSHGGNIALYARRRMNLQDVAMVTLGTPFIRSSSLDIVDLVSGVATWSLFALTLLPGVSSLVVGILLMGADFRLLSELCEYIEFGCGGSPLPYMPDLGGFLISAAFIYAFVASAWFKAGIPFVTKRTGTEIFYDWVFRRFAVPLAARQTKLRERISASTMALSPSLFLSVYGDEAGGLLGTADNLGDLARAVSAGLFRMAFAAVSLINRHRDLMRGAGELSKDVFLPLALGIGLFNMVFGIFLTLFLPIILAPLALLVIARRLAYFDDTILSYLVSAQASDTSPGIDWDSRAISEWRSLPTRLPLQMVDYQFSRKSLRDLLHSSFHVEPIVIADIAEWIVNGQTLSKSTRPFPPPELLGGSQ
jgi:hypothetical protein